MSIYGLKVLIFFCFTGTMRPTKSMILSVTMHGFHIDNYVAMFISQMIAIDFSKILFDPIKTIAVFFVMLKVV